jgi:hypothetical protein
MRLSVRFTARNMMIGFATRRKTLHDNDHRYPNDSRPLKADRPPEEVACSRESVGKLYNWR